MPDISMIDVIAIPEILSHRNSSLLTSLKLRYTNKVSNNPDDIVVYLFLNFLIRINYSLVVVLEEVWKFTQVLGKSNFPDFFQIVLKCATIATYYLDYSRLVKTGSPATISLQFVFQNTLNYGLTFQNAN